MTTRVASAVSAVAILTGQSDREADVELSGLADIIADPDRQRAIAAAYDALPLFPASLPDQIAASVAWRAFANEVREQWNALHSLGFRLIVEDFDPYSGPAEMFADVAEYRIRVLSSDVCGSHPFLSNETNDLFRAVHDILGHAATGRGFDRHGEEAAYQSHARLFSRTACLALATETRGQNASLHANGAFPEQKVGILPHWARATDALFPYGRVGAELRDLVGEAADYAARESLCAPLCASLVPASY